MSIVEIVSSIPHGSLRSYTWVARQLGRPREAARAVGQQIDQATTSRWRSPDEEARDEHREAFPWWRVVGINGEVRTIDEDLAWFIRHVERLQEDGHRLSADGLRVDPLPVGFE